MSLYQVRLEAPMALALQMVTALADADGIELVSSGHPSTNGDRSVVLHVAVEATQAELESAIGEIRAGLPDGASITLDDA